jgi:hypothetical protein
MRYEVGCVCRFVIWALFIFLSTLNVADADEADEGSNKRSLQRLAQRFEVSVAEDDSQTPLQMERTPAMFYIDPTREGADSGLWIWLRDHRPAAVLSVSIWPPDTPARRRFEAASLVNEPVTVALADDRRTLDEQTTTHRRLPTDLKPSLNPRLRLAQFKRLAKRFEATEDEVRGGPTKLRLLPVPIYQHVPEVSPSRAVVFAFAHGTNPEVILALEANESDSLGGWKYSLAAMAFARLTVSLDGEQVWTQPRYRQGKRRTMYTHGRFAGP